MSFIGNLKHEELVSGEYYTTFYKGQGLYTFNHNRDLWYSHEYKVIVKKDGRFVPDNGFEDFRLATTTEKKYLSNEVTLEDVEQMMRSEIGL